MKIIYNKYLPFKSYSAMALFPFIFTRKKKGTLSGTMINHEKIHGRQQVELLFAPFLVWYCAEWLIRLIQYRDRKKAYRNISFEREAYTNQYNLDYLKSRKLFAFIGYLKEV